MSWFHTLGAKQQLAVASRVLKVRFGVDRLESVSNGASTFIRSQDSLAWGGNLSLRDETTKIGLTRHIRQFELTRRQKHQQH